MTRITDPWERLLSAVVPLSRGNVEGFCDLPDAEWAAFLAECNLHWMTPFVYRALADTSVPATVPPAVWRQFEKMYRRSQARTRLADSVIVPVLSAFNAENIPVIALKGLHLSIQAYPVAATRPMIDADLMVRREHLPAAVRIVESFGFRHDEAATLQPHDNAHHLAPFWRPSGPPIEIHYGLEARTLAPGIDVEGLWDRASKARIGTAELCFLSPEDTLLHLCTHAAFHHAFAIKLLSLCDIAIAIDHWRGGIDWDAFWLRARTWGMERSVAMTFAFARTRLGYPLPNGAVSPIALREDLLGVAERQMREKATALAKKRRPKKPTEAGARIGLEVFVTLRCLPTLRDKVKFLVERTVVPQDELLAWFGLPSAPVWFPLLYPIRLAALMARHGPSLLRLIISRFIKRRYEPEISAILQAERKQQILRAWLTQP